MSGAILHRTKAATRILLSGVEVAVTETEAGTSRYFPAGCRCPVPSQVGHGHLAVAETCAAILAERALRAVEAAS